MRPIAPFAHRPTHSRRSLLSLAALVAAPMFAASLLTAEARANPLPARAAAGLRSEEPLRVVVTVPDLADLVTRIGGEHVAVTTLASANQNLHAVRVKPSHLVALSRADIFFSVGLSLEHAWVPGLLETARNRKVVRGAAGFVEAGAGFATIDKPEVLDRGQAVDVHPDGNPHVNLSFAGGPHLASSVLGALQQLAPQHAETFRTRHAAWAKEYEAARVRWDAIASAVRATGAAVCVVHREYDYLLRDLGLEVAASIEPRPGLAPTPSHLASVIEVARQRPIVAVVTAPWSNDSHAKRVGREAGVPVLELPTQSGGARGADSWITLVDHCVRQLALVAGVNPDEVVRAAAAKAAAERAADGG
jgi:zinc/manganese transport system substrate-binding protein